nr:conotoxin precursor M [Conus ebraeus]
MMLKLRVVLFILLVLFPLTTLQLDADQPVERYVENKENLNPDERRKIILPALRTLISSGCGENPDWCK